MKRYNNCWFSKAR